MSETLDNNYPAISDLRAKAKKRLPHFAFEYLDSGTGAELAMQRNRDALDKVLFSPRILCGALQFHHQKEFLGKTYQYPFGIAPIGMAGAIWGKAEYKLAAAAKKHQIPFCLSTVATVIPEDIGPISQDMGWFQLYPPKDKDILRDMIKRIKNAGFDKLIITVDVTGESRRERQRRAYLNIPPKLTLSMIISMMLHPTWSLLQLHTGIPRLKFPESYVDENTRKAKNFQHAGHVIRGYPDWDYLRIVRDEWQGHLIVKGVNNVDDAIALTKENIDAIWVSNHSARQLDASPATITQLPKIRQAVGDDIPIIMDSGVMGGLDIMRALALGADFVMMGRAFYYAIAALDKIGIDHAIYILHEDLKANMAQIGIEHFHQLSDRLVIE